MVVALATVAVFAAVLMIARAAATGDLALLYSGLESSAAGDVIAALDQRGVDYEVRGGAIYVDSSQRDQLRMSLAGEGLPANTGQGYELLDQLTGFGTTSQMFDAAYLRAKEGELARTILASPYIRTARVHISTPSNRTFQRDQKPTAAVTVTTAAGTLSGAHAKALRYLIAASVSGMSPDDVAVIDGSGGLIPNNDDPAAIGADSRAEDLRNRAEHLLEARVGYGNAVVEVSVDTVTESESIVERRIDPESRVAISTDVTERTDTSQDSRGTDVTVASNLPTGAASGDTGASTSDNSENRSLTNFEVSETKREVLRTPGAIRRMTVAVLINDVTTTDSAGATIVQTRTPDELDALRELVASAVGLDAERGDVITLKSMPFEPIAITGTEAEAAASAMPLNLMSLIQLGVLSAVALVLGLFVVRPIMNSGRVAALPPPQGFGALTGTVEGPTTATIAGPMAALTAPVAGHDEGGQVGGADPVTRLRKMIEERQAETVQILQSWIEDPEEMEVG
jgi:flagellar M-ring protein FliF